MNFHQTATEFEKATIENYESLAEKCVSNPGLRNILVMLAEDHRKHLKTLEALEKEACSVMDKTSAFKAARTLFESMKNRKKAFSCDLDQLRLYREARDLVSKKQMFYLQALDDAGCEGDRKILEQIADEERRQSIVLDNIIEMVDRPNTWIEDAEFNHLVDY